MDTTHHISTTTPPSRIIPPAQLWVGPRQLIRTQAERYLQQLFCTLIKDMPGGGAGGNAPTNCNTCTPCRLITQRQFHAVSWFTPEKQYTVDDIDELLSRMRFTIEHNTQFFFVLEHADALPPASANRLLKSIEEPPTGYHFILLAERKDAVIPTIRSRCLLRSWYTNEELDTHRAFIAHFTTITTQPLAFLSALDSAELNEQHSLSVLDAITAHWIEQAKSSQLPGEPVDPTAIKHATKVVELLTQAYHTPPMSGSTKLFWKNLYLQFAFLN